MRKSLILFTVLLLAATPCYAHFGTLIPSDDIITQTDNKTLGLQVKFIHPMEGHYMEMARPKQFGVLHNGRKTDLLDSLRAVKGQGPGQSGQFTFWRSDYKIRRPGDYTFFVEPTPYWEPAEDKFIVHYTKVCVGALGLESGWDQPVGLETEIIPLSRPYGLWSGNLFSGRVLLKGKPVPYAEIEVEYLNEAAEGGKIHPPSDPFVTQVIKADGNGVFHYAMPKAGWWGFAALSDADWKLQHDGVDKDVEIGAVYWIHTTELQ
ncbi:DUF4198 domain-containing protein [Geothermobacter hydrogeniphilus]|uniref:Cobalt/nickel transport protein n=1 Tax=Geothermobacter hydrogeniphilus TaxID=1969733 RepID=A0A1X0YA91_9BACT|nr:DUF4198 domain-containing protein [Geothermobacter hydrogeniphilus]ORJ62037.1 hypothetical protein B5V00_04605 [Geothermobacter hydrogeniphilus]